ncbi:MAG: LysM peptidoglycan-binding domain-containing protein [Desulfobacterales bacterium]|nr:LysM peptidoglycan-binding domain-containing protein [Desulfobacterales bacterium]
MNKFKSKQSKEIQMPVILIGAGLLAMIMFLFIYSLKGSGSDTELKEIEGQFDSITYKVERLDERVRDLEKLFKRVDNLEQTLLTTLQEAEKKAVPPKQHEPDAAVSKPAHITKKVPVKTPKKIKKTQYRQVPQYHQVTPGETLYSISRHYKLSVDQLRNINKLAPGAAIHPGQRLRVK